MAAPDSPKSSFSNGRRWLNWLNTLLAAAAVLAMVVMANYLADGHSRRFLLDRNSPLKLSAQTLHVLDNLTNDVTVTLFFDPHGPNEDIYMLASALLTEYQLACPRHLHVKTLDYSRNVGDAKEFLDTHHLGGEHDRDFVLVECGSYTKTAQAKELANFDLDSALSGKSKFVRRSAFLGELFHGRYL